MTTSSDSPFSHAIDGNEDYSDRIESMLSAGNAYVSSHFTQLGVDPSHDMHHIRRVHLSSLWLSRCSSLPHKPDMLVLQLAALFHDMADAKYDVKANAATLLAPFYAQYEDVLSQAQTDLVTRIVLRVSWSKDEKRRAARTKAEREGSEESAVDRAEREWEEKCAELWCVSDADRLDAIGSIGILRCAAFSAAKGRPLHIPPANPAGDSVPPAEQAEGYNGSCVAHFHEKLLKIKGDRLRTQTARAEAERRQTMMQSFLQELDFEWMVASQGAEIAQLE